MSRSYQVMVGNVGTVYDGADFTTARKAYSDYKALSKAKHGRAAGESVVFMDGGAPRWEWVGRVDRKGDA